MSNVTILYNNILLGSGVTVTGSSEATSMPDDNVQVTHPTEPWRITTLSGANLVIDLAEPVAWDAIALIATTATPHRNLLQYSQDFTNAVWTKTNCTPTADNTVSPDPYIPTYEIVDAGSGEHYFEDTLTKPYSVAMAATFSVYVNQNSASRHLRLYLQGASASHWAEAEFDLSDGSVNDSNVAGDFASLSTAATSLGSGWYRVSMTVTTDAHSAITARYQNLNASFLTFFAGGGSNWPLLAGGQLELDSSVGTWAKTTTGNASYWRVQGHSADSWGSPNYDSGLLNLPLTSNLIPWSDEMGFVHALYEPASVVGQRYLRILFYDNNNPATTLDVGVVTVGIAFSPTVNLEDGSLRLQWLESGGEDEARGGQTYRPVNSRRRQITFALQALTKAEAHNDVSKMQMIAGRSMPVLVSIDPADTDNPQEWTIYGFIEDLGAIEHRTRGIYRHRFSITEVLP